MLESVVSVDVESSFETDGSDGYSERWLSIVNDPPPETKAI
jgi:hypothetical protein